MMRRVVSEVGSKYRVLTDPDDLFVSSHFPKYDFLCSLEGKVWAEGMLVRDPDGNKMQVAYPVIESQEYCALVDTKTGVRWMLNKKNRTLIRLGGHQ